MLRGERDERRRSAAAEGVGAQAAERDGRARARAAVAGGGAAPRAAERRAEARGRGDARQERARTELADASKGGGSRWRSTIALRVPPLRDALEAEKGKCETLEADAATGAPSSPPSATLERLRGDYNQLSPTATRGALPAPERRGARDAMADQIKLDQGRRRRRRRTPSSRARCSSPRRRRASALSRPSRFARRPTHRRQRHRLAGQLRSRSAPPRAGRSRGSRGRVAAARLRLGLFQRMTVRQGAVPRHARRRDATLSRRSSASRARVNGVGPHPRIAATSGA